MDDGNDNADGSNDSSYGPFDVQNSQTPFDTVDNGTPSASGGTSPSWFSSLLGDASGLASQAGTYANQVSGIVKSVNGTTAKPSTPSAPAQAASTTVTPPAAIQNAQASNTAKVVSSGLGTLNPTLLIGVAIAAVVGLVLYLKK